MPRFLGNILFPVAVAFWNPPGAADASVPPSSAVDIGAIPAVPIGDSCLPPAVVVGTLGTPSSTPDLRYFLPISQISEVTSSVHQLRAIFLSFGGLLRAVKVADVALVVMIFVTTSEDLLDDLVSFSGQYSDLAI